MNRTRSKDRLWSIILAGGEGERLKAFVHQQLGQTKAKQYCSFVGTRSLFQHTLDRADQIAAADRKVTVIARSHWSEVVSQLAGREAGRVLLQPANRETAPGIFAALAHVTKHDPEATALIYPSDHFVYPERQFLREVQSLVKAAERWSDRLFLLGVAPDRLESDYGWIQTGRTLGNIDGHPIRRARAFWEKPDLNRCQLAMAEGSLWNTLILAAKAKTLWEAGWRCAPEMMRLFKDYQSAIGTANEDIVLNSIYRTMPGWNFSSQLLENASHQIAVMELKGVLWSDWGRPDRIVATLARLGRNVAKGRTASA